MIAKLKEQGSSATTLAEAATDPVVKKLIDAAVDGYNKVSVSRAQQIRKWVLMDRDLSLGHGELTATLKMKRNVVHEHYISQINKMYEE